MASANKISMTKEDNLSLEEESDLKMDWEIFSSNPVVEFTEEEEFHIEFLKIDKQVLTAIYAFYEEQYSSEISFESFG